MARVKEATGNVNLSYVTEERLTEINDVFRLLNLDHKHAPYSGALDFSKNLEKMSGLRLSGVSFRMSGSCASFKPKEDR